MSIAIVTTGGTIDKDYFDALSEYQIADSPLAELLRCYHVGFEFHMVPLMRKDSLELTEEDRATIADTIRKLPHEQVLVTHGTDTMVKTAQYLGKIPGKTVVFTGAMKPARFKDTDAIFNVGVAIGALQALKEGVYVAMSGQLFSPDNVVKNRAAQCFQTLDHD